MKKPNLQESFFGDRQGSFWHPEHGGTSVPTALFPKKGSMHFVFPGGVLMRADVTEVFLQTTPMDPAYKNRHHPAFACGHSGICIRSRQKENADSIRESAFFYSRRKGSFLHFRKNVQFIEKKSIVRQGSVFYNKITLNFGRFFPICAKSRIRRGYDG